MYFDSYWASFKIISLGPTRSMETFSQKKSIFMMKNTLVIFSRITEYGTPQDTVY